MSAGMMGYIDTIETCVLHLAGYMELHSERTAVHTFVAYDNQDAFSSSRPTSRTRHWLSCCGMLFRRLYKGCQGRQELGEAR